MFIRFFDVGLEDIVRMYVAHRPPSPGESWPAHFHGYIRSRVQAGLRVLLEDNPPSRRGW